MAGKALVIGGGIGGLAAGLGLRQAGWEVAVFERVPELGEVGAGISLWANALAALDRLGVGSEVRAVGLVQNEGWIWTRAGERLLSVTSPALAARFPELGLMVHRAELHAVLAAALGAGAVRTGAELTGLREAGGQVVARFADGTEAAGVVLIGADGIRSAVRQALGIPGAPRAAGYTCWRAVIPFPRAQLSPGETWGAGARFGQAPLRGGRVYAFATRNEAPGGRSPGGEKAELLRTFEGWHAPIPELIAAIPEAAILRGDIFDLPVLRSWGRGRITLLGDAAHAMTPNLGQGACQALEDAVVLAKHLRPGADVPAALRAYESERRRRAAFFVRRSRRVGAVAQWSHPLAVRLRAGLARHVLGRLQARQMAGLLATSF